MNADIVIVFASFFKKYYAAENFSFEMKDVMDTDFNRGLTTFNAGALTMVSSTILWKKLNQIMKCSLLSLRWLSTGSFFICLMKYLHDGKWQNASQLSDEKWVVAFMYVMDRTAYINESNVKLK
jgi:hypothetical protein